MKINYDLQGEKSLLGACLISQDCLMISMQALTPSHFYSLEHQLIFTCMQEIYKDGANLTVTTLYSKAVVKGYGDRVKHDISELKAFARAKDFKANLKNIQENHLKTQMAALVKKLAKNLNLSTVSEMYELISNAMNGYTSVKTYTLKEIAENEFMGRENFIDFIEYRQEAYLRGETTCGYPTGFPILDDLTNGLCESYYVALAGAPGTGKTTFAMQVMANLIKQGKKCAFLSLEMTTEQAYIKMISAETGIYHNKILKGDFNGHEYQLINEARHTINAQENLFVQDSYVKDTASLRARMKKLVEVDGAQVFVIDYLSLIKAPTINNPTERISHISDSIRTILKELKVPGLVLSQLNRAGTSQEEPQTYHLLGSSQIENDSYHIFILSKIPNTELVRLYIRKNRFGPLTFVDFTFNGIRFEEIDRTKEIKNLEEINRHAEENFRDFEPQP